MLKQRDIIERLNRLTIGYNLTWDDVKYDADRAIDKINGFLGSAFPPMSEVLTYPDATYSVRSGVYDYEIVKDIYILNIVLPYMAMEVLARDEEFTTVFNKYAAEVDNNLFTMFQREYHNIPEVFMQKGDVGVMFPAQSSYAGKNAKNALQLFKFKVVYHLDNEQVACITPVDTTAYEYGKYFNVLGGPSESITDDGIFVHRFEGWFLGSINGREYEVGKDYKITSDVHLHARWTKHSTLSVSNGYLSVSNDYKNQIVNLIVPEYVNGNKVTAFAASFFADNKSIQRLVIPGSFSSLNVEGYEGFQLDITKSNVPLTIETNCFRNCPNINSIFIPYRVRAIKAGAFPAQLNAIKTINCEILEINKPSGWVNGWYDPVSYNVVWGYNG